MFLSKYGVARHIYIPLVKRGVVDFAVGADFTPAAGDVKISKDGGAAANVTNLPTAIAMGNGAIWDFSLTATEMQAAQIVVTVADSATKAVEDQSFIIETHGNASAQFQVDLADSVRAGLTALPNATVSGVGGLLTAPTTANTGLADMTRILGTAVSTPATAGILDVNLKNIANAAVSTSTAQLGVNVVQAGATAWNSGAIKTTSFTAGAIDAAAIAADAIGASELAADAATEIGTAVWATAARTLTANTNLNDLSAAGVRAAIGLASANLDTQLDALPTNAELATALGTADDAVLAQVALVKAKTDNLPAAPAAVGDIPTANQNADALLDQAAGVETNRTLRQAFRLMLAALVGKASGMATTTATFRDTNDSKDRIVATVDADGNRSAVTLDAS